MTPQQEYDIIWKVYRSLAKRNSQLKMTRKSFENAFPYSILTTAIIKGYMNYILLDIITSDI